MKHVYLLGRKLYAFCAIDVHAKDPVVHVASSPSSRNAKECARKAVAKFGSGFALVNDNRSENMGEVPEYLASLGITQYWTRPRSPKDKPFVKRFIGTLQRECLYVLSTDILPRKGEVRHCVETLAPGRYRAQPHDHYVQQLVAGVATEPPGILHLRERLAQPRRAFFLRAHFPLPFGLWVHYDAKWV